MQINWYQFVRAVTRSLQKDLIGDKCSSKGRSLLLEPLRKLHSASVRREREREYRYTELGNRSFTEKSLWLQLLQQGQEPSLRLT